MNSFNKINSNFNFKSTILTLNPILILENKKNSGLVVFQLKTDNRILEKKNPKIIPNSKLACINPYKYLIKLFSK